MSERCESGCASSTAFSDTLQSFSWRLRSDPVSAVVDRMSFQQKGWLIAGSWESQVEVIMADEVLQGGGDDLSEARCEKGTHCV